LRALLIIDMINDFVHPRGKLFIPQSRDILPNLSKVVDHFRKSNEEVIFICDSHIEGDKETEIWGNHALEGEWGSQIVEELKPNPRDRIILKRRYSAFLYTDLDLYLRERGINTLYLSGVATNVCVLYTAADAFMRGYEVKVIEDCVASFSKEDHEFAIKQMREILKAEIVRSEEICTQR